MRLRLHMRSKSDVEFCVEVEVTSRMPEGRARDTYLLYFCRDVYNSMFCYEEVL